MYLLSLCMKNIFLAKHKALSRSLGIDNEQIPQQIQDKDRIFKTKPLNVKDRQDRHNTIITTYVLTLLIICIVYVCVVFFFLRKQQRVRYFIGAESYKKVKK